MRTLIRALTALLVATLAVGAAPPPRGPLVLAAASLQESMDAAADAWARAGHPRPILSFAASSALARQAMALLAGHLLPACDRPDDLEARGAMLLGAHLAHEERDGMALVQQHLTQADWERLDREVFAKDYRPSEVPAVLGWVVSGLSPDQARRLPGANAPFLAFGRLMAALFDRREARLFGGPTTTHCDKWTNGTAARSGIVVMPTSSLAWSTPRNGSCVQQFHLICAERGRVVPVPPPAETGRIAFVTETLWFGNDGLAGADALCATEATAAGLPGTFRAWLGSSAGGPDARFSTTGEPWRRVDGPRLAPTAAAFLTGDPLTTFANRTAQGAVVSTNTWTGADGQHCSDWTGAGNGTVGNPGSIGSERRAAFAQLCGLPNAVLCLEL